MHLKSVKILLFVLLSLTVACLLIGGGLSKPVYFLLAAAFAAGYAVAYAALWRCPFCGKALHPGPRRPAEKRQPRSAVGAPRFCMQKSLRQQASMQTQRSGLHGTRRNRAPE